MVSDFCWRGHASGLLQLGVQCDSGSPEFISVGDEREKLGGRNKADVGALSLPLSHAVLKKTPPPCTCSASSCLAGVEPLASERTSLLIVR